MTTDKNVCHVLNYLDSEWRIRKEAGKISLLCISKGQQEQQIRPEFEPELFIIHSDQKERSMKKMLSNAENSRICW